MRLRGSSRARCPLLSPKCRSSPPARDAAGIRTSRLRARWGVIDQPLGLGIVKAMFTMLGGDGKEYGPVRADQLKSWLREGRANLDTKVKPLNDTVWRRIGDLPEFGGPSALVSPPLLGVPPPFETQFTPEPSDPKLLADELIRRGEKIDVFACFEDGWELFKKNLWPFVGATTLFFLISYAVSRIPGTAGTLLSIVLAGPLLGGIHYFFLGRARGKHTDVGTLFIGFKRTFLPLMLATVLGYLFTVMGLILLILPGIYIAVALTFSHLLILDKGLEFWPAMELSRRVITAQWWQIFGLLLLGGLISALGLIALGVGFFFTASIATASLIEAYEQLCNPKRNEPEMSPL